MTDEKRAQIIAALQKSYQMEIETIVNYLANSIALDGVRAEEIKKSLAADVTSELAHAQQLAARIKTIGGQIPGSKAMQFHQDSLQPPEDLTDVVHVIKGVIAAEDAAVQQYNLVIKLCDGLDYVTQDLCIQILGDEENHRREFMGFLKEYEKK
ncbi:rubrerythrin [bacterium]|jgi:bacterioferritin|nr:rubrerythrin [bacterium]